MNIIGLIRNNLIEIRTILAKFNTHRKNIKTGRYVMIYALYSSIMTKE